MIRFDGQSVVVTGAGRGLGRLYALELARRGAEVVVNDIGGSVTGDGADESVADAVVEEIAMAGGTAVASHDAVDNPEAGTAIVKQAVREFGRVDAVVSNAGIFEMVPFEDMTFAQWRRMLQIHVDGTFNVVQAAYRQMKEQQYGRIVLISSNVGAFGQPLATSYGTAKGAILGLTNSLANEGAQHNINVNAVLPMGHTRMSKSASTLVDGEAPAERDAVMQAFFDATAPERVVPMVVFLASRECDLTHHYISAAAGRYARVFTALGEGWVSEPEAVATADDIAEHVGEIVATEPSIVPTELSDEIVQLVTRLKLV